MNIKKRLLIGLCSWSNPELLKVCINSLLLSIDRKQDDIAVVLNEADEKSMSFLRQNDIKFIALPQNFGVLAIDFLKPFIEQFEYFLDTNDDMLFAGNFTDDLISILESENAFSSSCTLIENFESGNSQVVVDTSLSNIYSNETFSIFSNNINSNKYISNKKIAYCHPICVKSKDFIGIGGYSNNWDWRWFSGYGADDFFAYRLYKLYNSQRRPICSDKSFVFHGSSQTMRRLPHEIRSQNGIALFEQETGINLFDFRRGISIGSII